MTPHEKLNFIQNIVYELLEGEVADKWIKSQLQEILYVIERVTPTHSDDLDNVISDYDNVHHI